MSKQDVLSKKTLSAIRAFKKQADVIVKRIAAERDNLRTLVEEYADILDSVDEGLSDVEHGVDRMSEFL